MDSYGFDKLEAETYLNHYCNQNQKRFLALRLPDVIGPYDNDVDLRFWRLVTWIKNSGIHPIELDSRSKSQKLSFVYSRDVATIIIMAIEKYETISGIYNLGFRE